MGLGATPRYRPFAGVLTGLPGLTATRAQTINIFIIVLENDVTGFAQNCSANQPESTKPNYSSLTDSGAQGRFSIGDDRRRNRLTIIDALHGRYSNKEAQVMV